MAPSITLQRGIHDFKILESDLKDVSNMKKQALGWFVLRIDELRAQFIQHLLEIKTRQNSRDQISEMLSKMHEFKDAAKARRLVIIADDEEKEKEEKEK